MRPFLHCILFCANLILGKGFNNIALGGSKTWGHLTWQSETNILLISRHNPNNIDCSSLFAYGFVSDQGAYAVNEYEQIKGEKKTCDNHQTGLDIHMNSYSALGNSCVSITKIEQTEVRKRLGQEFTTVVIQETTESDQFMVHNTVCATLTKNRLDFAEEDDFAIYRSWDHQDFALHMKNTKKYQYATYETKDCDDSIISPLEEVNGNFQLETWVRFGNENGRIRSIKIKDSNCYNLNQDLDWSRAGKMVIMDRTNTRSFKMKFFQDNPFVPTEFSFKYLKHRKEFNDENGNPGKYHIHVNKIGSSNTDCAATGGHFNPYSLTAPFAENSQTDYDYETGDLSLRYGDLIGKDEVSVQAEDWNLPLFGVNAINEMSITFHDASDSSRLVCYNLIEARRLSVHYQRLN